MIKGAKYSLMNSLPQAFFYTVREYPALMLIHGGWNISAGQTDFLAGVPPAHQIGASFEIAGDNPPVMSKLRL
jgi:hypothetical protein